MSSRSLRARRALTRRLPIGAEVAPGGVDFRVWAPRRGRVEVVLEAGRIESLEPESAGYFRGFIGGIGAGTRYRFRLDGDVTVPDPASRFQPDGPHGASEVIDPGRYRWSDHMWRGVPVANAIIYEMHVGTLTPDGSWRAAGDLLPYLADLGVTVLELMPVADFPGRFGWGYDGVNLFAPTRLYGRPDEFRAFVDRAHGHGLAVVLDVVYNHLGPSGNYLRELSADYFTDRYVTPWGESLNFDGDASPPVRELIVSNAEHWIAEYHLDGLRLDATHAVNDASPRHILADVAERVRRAGGGRHTIMIAEDEPQRTFVLAPVRRGGWGIDAIWHDDFHHSMRIAATGRREGYFARCTGRADELAAYAVRLPSHGEREGSQASYITFLQNHDQVSVAPGGRRLHQLTSPGRWRALTSLLLLGPGTPMLFAGEEFAATAPFLFFADHEPGLAQLVRTGRARHLAQFASLADPAVQAALPDPADPTTFHRCRLDPGERLRHAEALRLHRDLIALRREGVGLNREEPARAAALTDQAFVIRAGGTLLVINLGGDLELAARGSPLMRPPEGTRWSVGWSSDAVAYGGPGVPEAARAARLSPGESALLLVAG